MVAPEDDFTALVRSSPPETRFLLLPGIHRTGETEPKDGMVFEGMEGTILSGATVLDGFEEDDGRWELRGPRLNMRRHGECVNGYTACGLINDLYVDDIMLWRVEDRDELEPGAWWSDGSLIVIADDPTDRKIEISLVEHAFRSDADDVTIRNLIVEKYAPLAQSGAIQAQRPGEGSRGDNWLIEDVEARLNHAAGIRAGDGTIIRRVYAHHNGQQGITGGAGTNVLVEDSELAYNNLRGFSPGWECGGAKFTRTDGLVLRNLTVHHNLGPGLWVDIDARNTLYEDNVVYSNNGAGIFHEISFEAVIRNNEVYDNGFSKSEWLWGAGILIAASTDVEVYDNVVTNNADGITGIQQDRNGDLGPSFLANLDVHDNVVTMWYGQTGVVEDTDDPAVFTERNLRFNNNTYIGAGHEEAFAWDGKDMTWEQWQEAGQDTESTRSDG
ncbi:MAG: right-handed parallel beta-helix repeat-containing protein [Acidimicrobiia bacterium]|nr:right-handed parallel beta-helix repeat-containing protein [Acidimicrobiia bacterium]